MLKNRQDSSQSSPRVITVLVSYRQNETVDHFVKRNPLCDPLHWVFSQVLYST